MYLQIVAFQCWTHSYLDSLALARRSQHFLAWAKKLKLLKNGSSCFFSLLILHQKRKRFVNKCFFLRKRFVNKRKITYWQNGFTKKCLAILFVVSKLTTLSLTVFLLSGWNQLEPFILLQLFRRVKRKNCGFNSPRCT